MEKNNRAFTEYYFPSDERYSLNNHLGQYLISALALGGRTLFKR